ncbi:MAG: HAMP domain-containing protein [Reyranella sp.]|uniref:adenylate/guanylate cyclase domain-containing protein n=1 Tax=Reyranella sp. TaxID=1929291 RepID=UPI00122303E1|nr:adenylate/guanylate cyclase domain-containing protein [Reyranella sp.]TAJ85050.1 MAG: HAMP domain-containing protein [Reyranella sp.]TBR27301.1 MAG: HAMP domain-containing protein [Reyranella sp.]
MTFQPAGAPTKHRSLFWKYFRALFAAVVAPLMIAGAGEAWFGYHDQRARLNELLDAEARLAAVKIHDFIEGIQDQLSWTVQLPWTDNAGDRRMLDAMRLLRQAPAVESLALVDGTGRERLFVSRIGLNRVEAGEDRSATAPVTGARADRVWFGPVTFQNDSEPFMTIAVAGNRAAVGVAVAEVNLKFIWEVVSGIRVGRTGEAFVLDEPGRLVAHPDISLVLRADQAAQAPLQALRAAIQARAPGQAAAGRDITGKTVIAAMAQVPGVDWQVVVKQPIAEAYAPIYAALWRLGFLLVAGGLIAAALASWLSQRMVEPIRVLEDGVARIGAGQFDHRISLPTSDEFERLATRFNEMAGELAVSRERSERIARLKRFLAPQIAELIDRTGDERVLDGRRVEVAVLFCDIRGFTSFSANAEPEEIIDMLREYYDALERVVSAHGATLVNFFGDGVMVLLNAPVPCTDPELRATEMAIDMQANVQKLLVEWRKLHPELGFGIGLAMGPATVGRIGSGGRLNYTAIGNVVNLASRLCSSAADSEILVDLVAAAAIGTRVPLAQKDSRMMKGFDRPVPVFVVDVARGAALN